MDSQQARIKVLSKGKLFSGEYILYWMQQSQRADFNHALEFAVLKSNEMNLPLLVCFGISQKYLEATSRSYLFMLEGLLETSERLRNRGISLVIQNNSPQKMAVELAKNAALLVTDRGYLRIQKDWKSYVSQRIECSFLQIETDVIVPVDVVSQKQEYAARTIRPKIHKIIPDFLEPVPQFESEFSYLDLQFESVNLNEEIKKYENKLSPDKKYVKSLRGGYFHAMKKLYEFIEDKLDSYDKRNDPSLNLTSGLSPYLHFGQISALEVALAVMRSGSPKADLFLEELIVRRELAVNFVNYNPAYDTFEGIPAWAKKSLNEHESDPRPYLYSEKQLISAATHDEYWNAAHSELMKTGKMHSYMRMYWCKKIIEWTDNPVDAFKLSLKFNNKYAIDGRDPSSYTGISWCFGTHDRPWKKRSVFGMIRYMAASGLERKFDIKTYVKKIEQIK